MKSSRRSFLEAGLGLPVLLGAAPSLAATSQAAETTASKDSSFDPWVEIHRENLRHNVQEISRRVASRPILAVIKNNGYGMGVANVARLLEPQPEIFGFAVVKLHEAISLRDSGIRKPILLLGPFDEKNLEHAVARSVMPMVYTPLGPELDNIAAKTQKPVPLHICVDTGIGRVGVPYYQAAPLVRDLAARKSVLIQGTMMTFTEDPDFDKEQLRRFNKTVMDLYPAISLKARVIYAKKLRPGDSAGYNRAYVAKDDVWVATLPVGHADGWPRTAPKGAKVRIKGDLYPVIASVSASHCIVEIGGEERVKIGDIATFFDVQPGSRPEDISEACGTSVYDLTMHLSPLLPRRIM